MNSAYKEYIKLAHDIGDGYYPERNPTWMHHYIELKTREAEYVTTDSDG